MLLAVNLPLMFDDKTGNEGDVRINNYVRLSIDAIIVGDVTDTADR